MSSLTIRHATPDDAEALADLLTQLGYPTGADPIPERLAKLRARAGTAVLVAEHRGRAVAVVTVHLFDSLHTSEPVAWLTAVVVDEAMRGKGVGSAIVKRAEEWAIQQGARKVSLTSALRRKEAHQFYLAGGYEHTGVRLSKNLGEAGTSPPDRPAAERSPTNQPT
ncbi:MAG: GNAT family N-acetyltransferase [Gemmatimonadaceae bacterium]